MKKLFSSLKGFTLVEIMLAAAILVAVMAAFLSSFTSTFKSTNYSQGISLAGRAVENKVEEMVNFTFDSLMAQYGANGTGRNFTFDASGLIGAGVVDVIDRPDLYRGGETLVINNAPWSARFGHSSLVYDNKIWIFGGFLSGAYANDVWCSSDGTNWTVVTNNAAWPGRYWHCSLVYDNKMWVIGGQIKVNATHSAVTNDVWYSHNGITWINATNSAAWLPRQNHAALVYDNKMWIFGGNTISGLRKDVWYSYDGVNWSSVTTTAPWGDRAYHSSLVFDNKMWIIGGLAGGYKKDVWYSSDGINWVNATNAAPWAARTAHNSLVYDNKMWIIGGTDGWVNIDDVWYSSNGVNWTCAANVTAWPGRRYCASVVYDNKMWVMGGWDGATRKNDVWFSPGYNRILEAAITISWRHPDNRTFGEDTNLDGFWDNATEDVNGNGIYDSPARLRQLLVEDSTTGKLRRIYMGR